MIGRIYAIAINTFREAVRDRVLHGVIGLGAVLLAFTLALAELALNEQRRIVMDVGLATISLLSVVVAVFLGSSHLYKEIEKKTLYVILPKPIRRWEFLLGKYFGIVLSAVTFIAIVGAILMLVAATQAGAPTYLLAGLPLGLGALLFITAKLLRDLTAAVVPWSLVAVGGAMAVAATTDVEVSVLAASLLLCAGEVLVLSAVALLFGSFSTPFLTGGFTVGVWLVGRSADDMATMRSDVLGDDVKAALRVLAEVVPNFNLFVPGRHTLTVASEAHGGPWVYVATTMGYAVLYAAVALVLAALVFRRRDFL